MKVKIWIDECRFQVSISSIISIDEQKNKQKKTPQNSEKVNLDQFFLSLLLHSSHSLTHSTPLITLHLSMQFPNKIIGRKKDSQIATRLLILFFLVVLGVGFEFEHPTLTFTFKKN